MADPFRLVDINVDDKLFEQLRESARFEVMGPGREVAVLVDPDERGVPIVRTTSNYQTPAQIFGDVHQRVADEVVRAASLSCGFNNAMLEHYTNAYSKMKAHSDQALDLDSTTQIAIVSCYADPSLAGTERTLVVEPKRGGESFEIPLRHSSAVVFSVDDNRRFKHKIILDRSANPPENEWLGLTLRCSSRFVRHAPEPTIDIGPLTLATSEQEQHFYRLRAEENRQVRFNYPKLSFTVSASDLRPPVH